MHRCHSGQGACYLCWNDPIEHPFCIAAIDFMIIQWPGQIMASAAMKEVKLVWSENNSTFLHPNMLRLPLHSDFSFSFIQSSMEINDRKWKSMWETTLICNGRRLHSLRSKNLWHFNSVINLGMYNSSKNKNKNKNKNKKRNRWTNYPIF